MNARDALRSAIAALARHRCAGADAAREAEVLLVHAARTTRERLAAAPERALTPSQEKRFRLLVARRLRHEPLAYILGTAWFRGREFLVSRKTLIPRPATEHIVDAAVAAAKRIGAKIAVDVGAGSGCIAISLALELPNTRVIATDSSASALALAKKNARRLGSAARIRFIRADLLSSVRAIPSPAVIVANLPYIPTGEIKKLITDIRRFEPRTALDGGKDGLDLYRRLVLQLRAASAHQTTLICEILPEQYAALAAFIKKNFPRAATEEILNFSKTVVGLAADLYGTTV